MYALSNEPITPGKGLGDTVELEGVRWCFRGSLRMPFLGHMYLSITSFWRRAMYNDIKRKMLKFLFIAYFLLNVTI